MSGAPSPRIALALVVALPFIACSEQSPPLGQTETDAGFAPDDGGEAADAGSTATPDAGHPADAGQVADAGVDIDAGTAPDAGVEGTGYGWNAYLGAHYGTRPWARGGLRDPAGAGSNGFRPVIDGADILDDRLSTFETRTLPVLAETLAAGGSVVLQAAGGESYWQAMELPGGRAAFEAALRARVDLIQGLPGVGDWTSQVVFQFGNEIQNPERFYGEVCSAATGGVETNCDFATAFAPYYVDHLLAPGAEILRAKSQELFGRPDAIRVALGSVVNLVTRRTFVEGLLEREVGGDLAPTLAGQRVARFVDTVTIHYTMPSAQAPEVLDDFFDTWTAPSADSAVRALWMTEEVGVRAASSGEGLAVALRSFVPAQRWWRARGLSPEQAHLFIWGAEVACEAGLGPDCQSIDEAMPTFAGFVGDGELVERDDATAEASATVTVTSFTAGPDRRVVLVWGQASAGAIDVSSVTVDLSGWAGRTVTATLREAGAQGFAELPVTSSDGVFRFAATLEGREVLVLMLEAD